MGLDSELNSIYWEWYIWNHQGFSAFHGCALYNNLAIKNIDNVHVKLSYKIFDFKIPHPSPGFFLLDNLIYSLFFIFLISPEEMESL